MYTVMVQLVLLILRELHWPVWSCKQFSKRFDSRPDLQHWPITGFIQPTRVRNSTKCTHSVFTVLSKKKKKTTEEEEEEEERKCATSVTSIHSWQELLQQHNIKKYNIFSSRSTCLSLRCPEAARKSLLPVSHRHNISMGIKTTTTTTNKKTHTAEGHDYRTGYDEEFPRFQLLFP